MMYTRRDTTRSALRGALLLACSLLFASQAWAGKGLTVSWDHNPEPDIAGYKLYYADHSGEPYDGSFADQGPSPIDVPVSSLDPNADPSVELTGIAPCTVLYIAMTAYNDTGAESGFTEELSVRVTHKIKQFSAKATDLESLLLSWEPPAAPHQSAISKYLVYYEVSDKEQLEGAPRFSQMLEVDGAALDPQNPELAIDGLTPGAYVHLAVAAGCPSGEASLSETFTTQMPRPGQGDPSGDGGGLSIAGGCAAAPAPARSTHLPLLLLGLALLCSRRRAAKR